MTNPWSWYRGRPPIARTAMAILAAVVVAVLLLSVVSWVTDTSCAAGVDKRAGDDECTGVTDGGYHYFDALGPVSDRIKRENDRVTESGRPYATIAMMIPMTPEATDASKRTQILQEVQGAYIAQLRANQGRSPQPPIRLVLANPGSDMKRWKEVCDQLADLSRSRGARLRAVFGFNLSVERTKLTIDYLTRTKHIAVVGGPITADDLANDPAHPDRYPGLAKVVPSNRDQARALSAYLGVKPKNTFLVEDTHEGDLYARDLRAAFREMTRGTPYAPEQYDAEHVIPNDFAQMVNNLCNSRATAVYFSGRPPALALLINALGKRGCMERHIRLVTVSGASTIALDPTIDWKAFTRGAGFDVEYATITHEGAWTSGRPPTTGGSPQDFTALRELIHNRDRSGDIGPVDLADGRTITTHDSALTAIEGIRSRVTRSGEVPELSAIPAAWPRLHGPQKVLGAGGWICLTGHGTPYDKAVAIVRLVPDPQHIKFVRLGWPEGRPPTGNCKAVPG